MYYFKRDSIRDAATQVRREPDSVGVGTERVGVRGGRDADAGVELAQQAGVVELYPAVGQIDGDGSEGRTRGTTHAGSLTIAVSPTARQTGEFLRKAEGFVWKLGMRAKGGWRQ